MFCQNCGNKIIKGDSFCTNCGTPANATATPQVTPAPVKSEDDKKANKLCTISLILKYGVGMVLGAIYGVIEGLGSKFNIALNGSGSSIFEWILTTCSFAAGIAAFVLMIIVRVKYPKNTFGKVLMWIYIAEIIVAVISMIVLFIMCMSCIDSLRGCS